MPSCRQLNSPKATKTERRKERREITDRKFATKQMHSEKRKNKLDVSVDVEVENMKKRLILLGVRFHR